NMALNSYVTADGREIGRAQGVQAEACGIEATTDMNPVLIKPTGDMHSQIVVHGKPYQHLSAMKYREDFLPVAKPIVMDALNRLRDEYQLVVMEGAGSPAEINLKQRDIVNMNLAGWAEAPVILVGDIDRGGVFAFLVGTLELLEPEERARVKGFIINKFRGDLELLRPGLDWLEQRTGIPVLGVLPFLPDLEIEAEDSVILDSYASTLKQGRDIDIAVIRYPRISNFTDFDMLAAESDVSVRYVQRASELGEPDVIILPGSKDTISDLAFLREQELDGAIEQYMERSAHSQLVGICGGYQMLGDALLDPEAVESGKVKQSRGLGWLPLTTTFLPGKKTIRTAGHVLPDVPLSLYSTEPVVPVGGYEIHSGETVYSSQVGFGLVTTGSYDVAHTNDATSTANRGKEAKSLFLVESADGGERTEGICRVDGRVFGTYLHGLFNSDAYRRAWLDGIRQAKGLEPMAATFSAAARREMAFNRLADHVRRHLDMDQIYEIASLPKNP
ncbi:MAG TPA: cobyric acid synthase, partial [Paenibacillus sp.]